MIRGVFHGPTQIGDGNTIVTHLPPEHPGAVLRRKLAEWDDLAAKTRSAPGSPAALLDAHRAVVPFRGRAAELQALAEWCAAPGPGIRLLHGPGGQGKTRLAHRLTGRLADEPGDGPWSVLWLGRHAPADELTLLRYTDAPLLVVVDNAETRTGHLPVLLETAVAAPGAVRFKVLLLARTDGDWWHDLRAATGLEELYDAPVTPLLPLQPDPAGHAEAYRDAVDGLARALPQVPGQDHHDWTALAERVARSFAYRTRPPDMEVALTLHMTALVDLLDAAHQPAGGTAGARPMEERLLDYERRHWIAVEADLGLKKRRGIEAVLAAAFLCGAADEEEADALLGRVPVLDGQTTDVRWAVRDWIGALYPPPNPSQVWGTLRPDRLAEYFLGSRLRADPHLADRLLAGATGAQATRLLALHTRAAGHPAHHGRLDAELTALCTRHPEVLGPAAVDVATRVERPEPLVSALYRMTDDPRTDPAHLMALLDRLPVSSHNLAPWALHLTRRLTGIHRARADRDGSCPPELALLIRKLCARLLAMGLRQEAYEVAEEAVRRLRPAARPDAPELLPHLAASLHNLSVALGSVGRRADAMGPAYEAVSRYRELVAGSGGGPAAPVYRSELAHALNAVAAAEGELGRPERALTAIREAVGIRRQLVGSRSDAAPALRAELADGLNNLAIWHQECGELGQALESSRESVRRYQELAEERPDAFRPGHARSLGTYANCLRRTGRYADALRAAQEALGIRRRLAGTRPDAYLPDLAHALNGYAIDLGESGRLQESVEAGSEAVDLHRRLHAREPAVFAAPLALSLNTYANQLDSAGRPEEALEAACEAVGLHRPLAGGDPAVFGADLAMSLHTYANQLHAVGRTQEALEAARESVGIHRRLAGERPGVFLHGLASGLNNLALRLNDAGFPEEAAATAEEAVDVARRLRETDDTPPVRADLAMALTNRASRRYEAGCPDDAVRDAREARDLLRDLVRADGEDAVVHAPRLAQALRLLGLALSAAGLPNQALEAAEEEVGLLRRADGRAATADSAVRLTTALGHLGRQLTAACRHGEAAEVLLEAVRLRRDLPGARPADGSAEFVLLLGSAGEALVAAERRTEALPLLDEAVALLDGPLRDAPAGRALLGALLPLLGVLRQGAGLETAGAVLRRAVEVAEGLVRTEPAHAPVLQRALCVLGAYLVDRREPEEGRELLDRATDLGRVLAAADPAQLPALAWALAIAGHYPAQDEPRRPGAVETTAEAVALGRRLAGQAPGGPAAHEPLLAWALADHGLRLAEAARYDEALRTGSEAVTLARRAGQKPYLAFALYARATIRLLAQAEPGPAREDIARALALYRGLAREEPGLVATYLTSAERTRRCLARDPRP
ncbi:tetratricopeptide repeat protein [Streptomyces sp. NPDC013953]|uniref:tetratricopeptide repeat protein n=1 Tax=Streptomyces sp. NPDC013953 TaxID=3364868 RepID=UPI0036FE8F6F